MIKIFGASDYDGIAKYWVNMSEDSPDAICRQTKIIGEYRKSSRMKCTYKHIYSYNTIVGTRVGDNDFILTSTTYSNTTSMQVGLLSRSLREKNARFTFALIPENGMTLNYMKHVISIKMRNLRLAHEAIARSRKEHTRNEKILSFNSMLQSAIVLMRLYYASNKKAEDGKDIDIAMSIDYRSDINDAEKRILSVYNKRASDKRYRMKMLNAKKLYPDYNNMKIITSGNKELDMMTLAILSGKITMPFKNLKIDDFDEKLISGKRYYKYKGELIDAEVTDKLISIYYEKISNKDKNEYA